MWEPQMATSTFRWRAGAAVLGGRLDGDDVELAALRLEGLVGEYGVDGRLRIGDIGVHLALLISFGHEGDVDAMVGVGGLLKGDIWGDILLSDVPDEDVLWCHRVCHLAHHLSAVVAECHRHIHRVFGHGHEKHVLEGAAGGLGLGVGEPLLEQGGEEMAVDHLARAVAAHRELSVAVGRQFGQTCLAPVPSG